MKRIPAFSAIVLAAALGLTGCSDGQSKEAEASASASAQQLQQVDAKSTLESFFASVKADTVSSAKAPAGTGFAEVYKGSLAYISGDAVEAAESEALITKISTIYKDHPTATFVVEEEKLKLDSGKSLAELSDLTVYEDSGKSVAMPKDGGSLTVSRVNDKDLITGVALP